MAAAAVTASRPSVGKRLGETWLGPHADDRDGASGRIEDGGGDAPGRALGLAPAHGVPAFASAPATRARRGEVIVAGVKRGSRRPGAP